ncbi:MAG: winged helix-turn-helix domain-containing protein [Myxococcota bacterium]
MTELIPNTWTLVDGNVDLVRGVVSRESGKATLTTRELQLLRFLVAREGEDVERDELLREVWGYRGRLPTTRAPDFAVRRVRGKIEVDPSNPMLLLTVRSHGYRLVPPLPSRTSAMPLPEPVVETTPVPREVDLFVGRDDLLSRLHASVAATQVTTLLGPGGVGKTRLAIHFAAQYSDEVVFCDLSEAHDRADACLAVARGLGVQVLGDEQAIVVNALRQRAPLLVILDNVEQVVKPMAQLLPSWIEATERVQFVVTSRVRLRIPGELNLLVGPLSAPAAAALFRERAEAAGATPLPAADEPRLRKVVALLDCLPLAIELAASRSRVLDLDGLADRIHQRFQILASPKRTKHNSILAILEESWFRLDPLAQQALAQLTVFPGSFTLEAAEAVIEVEGAWSVDLVEQLMDHSLVRRHEGHRFHLLAMVRDFASGFLNDEGAAERHGRYYAGWRTDGFQKLDFSKRRSHLPEAENLTVACRRAIARHDIAVATRTLFWVSHVVATQGVVQRLADLVDAMASLPIEGWLERSCLAASRGLVAHILGNRDQAAIHWQEERECCLRANEPARASAVLFRLGVLVERVDPELAKAQLERCLAEARACEAGTVEVRALYGLGDLALLQRDFDSANHWLQSALARCGPAGDPAYESVVRRSLARVGQAMGRPDEARTELERSLAIALEWGEPASAASTRVLLADILAVTGAFDDAHRAYTESARDLARFGVGPLRLARVSARHAMLYLMQRKLHEAEETAHRALHTVEGLGAPFNTGLARLVLANVSRRQGHRGDALRDGQAALALARTIRAPSLLGETLLLLAGLAAEGNEFGLAQGYLDEAAGLIERLHNGAYPSRVSAVEAECAYWRGDTEQVERSMRQAWSQLNPHRVDARLELERVNQLIQG